MKLNEFTAAIVIWFLFDFCVIYVLGVYMCHTHYGHIYFVIIYYYRSLLFSFLFFLSILFSFLFWNCRSSYFVCTNDTSLFHYCIFSGFDSHYWVVFWTHLHFWLRKSQCFLNHFEMKLLNNRLTILYFTSAPQNNKLNTTDYK